MTSVFEIVVPVFGLIAIGYAISFTSLLPEQAGEGLSKFVYAIAVPILLMRSLITADFADASPWALWATYFTGVASVWLLATLFTVYWLKRGVRASVIAGVAAGFSNLVLMGIPLIQLAYGKPGLDILLLIIAIHLPTMMTAATVLMEFGVKVDGASKNKKSFGSVFRAIGKNLLTNPIIIGILVGLIWRFSDISFGGSFAEITRLIGITAGPLALLSLGMGFKKYGIKGNLFPGFVLATLSLTVMPALVYSLSVYVFVLPPLWIKVAVMAAACPTGVNAYLFAIQFNKAQGMATNAIVVAAMGSMISIPFWLHIVSSV